MSKELDNDLMGAVGRAHVPPMILEGLREYAVNHRPTGSFLKCVLENDLMGAVGRADAQSMAAFKSICAYVYNCLPGQCWGSAENVEAWLKEQKQ